MKTEARIQQQIFVFYQNNYCRKSLANREMIFHVANEGQHHLMSIGLLAGVADIFCTINKQPVFIEVKTPVGKQSPKQKEFEKHCYDVRIPYYIVRSLEDFKELLK